jgi:hypothetical protein
MRYAQGTDSTTENLDQRKPRFGDAAAPRFHRYEGPLRVSARLEPVPVFGAIRYEAFS